MFGQIAGALGAYFGGMYGGPAGAKAGYATASAAFGVAPGHNYTGGAGSCRTRSNEPNEQQALYAFFANLTGNDPLKFYAVIQYYEFQKARGEPSILDGLNTDRKSYTVALIALAMTNQVSPEFALYIYLEMTKGMPEPTNGIDAGSYNHDFSNGSSVIQSASNDPRTANKRWMKNAWKNAHNPYDAFVASTGIVLFSLANLVSDVTHIPAGRYPHVPYKNYKPGWKNSPCRKGCNIGSF